LDPDDLSDAATTNKFVTAADVTKLGNISVTQAVDLDEMETNIAALSDGMVFKDEWDASLGTFPGGGSAQIGWFYHVSAAGTVDGVAFAVGDSLVAKIDNASTTTYAANWVKFDQTDAVQSVAGKTGAVTIQVADVTDAGSLAALNSVSNLEIDDEAVSYAKIQHVSATDKLLGRSTAGSGDVEEIDCTAAGRALLDDVDALSQRTTLGLSIGIDVQAYSSVLDATTASFLVADETKLDGIEAFADVTDAINVDAAGAVMESDTSTASMSFVVDEDDMASDSATKVPTQQSVKAYSDNHTLSNARETKTSADSPVTMAYGVSYVFDCSSGAITANLPAASAGSAGERIGYTLKDATNAVTFVENGADTINWGASGADDVSVTGESGELVTDGSTNFERT